MADPRIKDETGTPIDMMAFRFVRVLSKPTNADASQLLFPVVVVTKKGEEHGEKGDWLIIQRNGQVGIILKKDFPLKYEIL